MTNLRGRLVASAARQRSFCSEYFFRPAADLLGYPGKIFIRGLTLVVLPYICTSMFVSQKTDPDADGDNGARPGR